MKSMEYKLGADARDAMTEVAQFIGNTLGSTLGPAGRNYFLRVGITNDGRTIVSNIEFNTDNKPDEIKNAIVLAFEEIALRQDSDAGDGTTTALVLGTQLAEDVLKEVSDLDAPVFGSKSVIELMRQLDTEGARAVELLTAQAKKIESKEELDNVAFTSMEGHEGYKVVSEMIWESGSQGNTATAEGHNGKIEKDIQPGITYPLRIESPSMYTRADRKQAIYNNVPILVANHVFEAESEITNFMVSMTKSQPPEALVIIAKQFSVPFVSAIVKKTRKTGFPILLLSTGINDDEFEDIASFIDAKVVDTHPKYGVRMEKTTIESAGFASQIIAGAEQTTIVGGRGLETVVQKGIEEDPVGYITRVEERVKTLEEHEQKETNPEKREMIGRRKAGLLGGIATLYVDAKTAVDRFYLRLKAEDAVNSCKAALDQGVVRGGGLALLEVADQMEGTLLENSLRQIHQRICRNAGGDIEIAENVVDPLLTVTSAIKNAVAVVKTLITTEGIFMPNKPSMVESLKSALLE